MIKGKDEAISVSNEDVEIYVMDEDNVSQDIRMDVETLRGELLKKRCRDFQCRRIGKFLYSNHTISNRGNP